MRGLLLLSIVGVALYALLLFTDNVLRDSETEDAFAKAQPSQTADRTLRAWGSNLPRWGFNNHKKYRSSIQGGFGGRWTALPFPKNAPSETGRRRTRARRMG